MRRAGLVLAAAALLAGGGPAAAHGFAARVAGTAYVGGLCDIEYDLRILSGPHAGDLVFTGTRSCSPDLCTLTQGSGTLGGALSGDYASTLAGATETFSIAGSHSGTMVLVFGWDLCLGPAVVPVDGVVTVGSTR